MQKKQNVDVAHVSLSKILSGLSTPQWVASLTVIFAIIAIIFKAGVEYHTYTVSKDEKIQQLKIEIRNLNKEIEKLSNRKTRLEKDKQQLNDNNKSLTQSNKILKQDLQNTNNKLNYLMMEIERLRTVNDSLSKTTLYEVAIDLSDFLYQIPNFKIFLDDKLKAQGIKNNFKLIAEEGIYKLKIQYNDNANRTWEYIDSLVFNSLTSKIHIYKSGFKLR